MTYNVFSGTLNPTQSVSQSGYTYAVLLFLSVACGIVILFGPSVTRRCSRLKQLNGLSWF